MSRIIAAGLLLIVLGCSSAVAGKSLLVVTPKVDIDASTEICDEAEEPECRCVGGDE